MSYRDVFGLDEPRFTDPLAVGDFVSGENSTPVYRVIAVEGERAWVRNTDTGADHIAQIARLKKVNP